MTAGQDSRDEIEVLLIRLLQKEYNLWNEIEEFTKELSEAMDRDDQVSIGMVLKMRGQTMAEVDKAVKERELVLDAGGEKEERLRKLVKGERPSDLTEPEEKICRLAQNRRSVLERTARMDQRISTRLAGEKSFYSK